MTAQDFLIAPLLSTAFLVTFICMEWLKRKYKLSPEFTRRFAHISSGLFALVDFYLVSGPMFIVLVGLGTAFIVLSHWKNVFTSIHNVKRKTLGEIYLPIGQLAAYLISGGNTEIFVPALLIITFADSLAGITSDLLRAERKIIWGSLVFFVTSLSVLLLTAKVSLPTALLIAAGTTLVERFSSRGTDNVTVPVAASLLLLL